jgi:hypothetical protein
MFLILERAYIYLPCILHRILQSELKKNTVQTMHPIYLYILIYTMPTVAEWSRRTYPAPLGAGGVGSIPSNSDAENVPSFRRWRFAMKLSPFILVYTSIYCVMRLHTTLYFESGLIRLATPTDLCPTLFPSRLHHDELHENLRYKFYIMTYIFFIVYNSMY